MDAADRPFDFGLTGGAYRDVEIVVSDAGAAIEARATDARNAAVTAFSLVVFPTSRDLWFPDSRHLKTRRSGPDGTARVTGLPPGDYYVAAVNRLPTFAVWRRTGRSGRARAALRTGAAGHAQRTRAPDPDPAADPPSGQPTLNRAGPSNVSIRWNSAGRLGCHC